MTPLEQHFREIVERGIRESRWFRTAPAEFQSAATVTILGIEQRKFGSMLGTTAMRPTLIAECECGGEVQRFSLLLDNTELVEVID